MEASGTIVPDVFEDLRSPYVPKPPAPLPHVSGGAPPILDPAVEEGLLVSDFQAVHVDAEVGQRGVVRQR